VKKIINFSTITFKVYQSQSPEKEQFIKVQDKMREHYTEIMAHMNLMRQYDEYDSIRKSSAEQLGKIIQDKINEIQNPSTEENCNSSPKLVCLPANKHIKQGLPDCGWGCLINHLLICFLNAFVSERMLVFDAVAFGLDNNFR
jgi:glycoprotein 6-alpha-L-fucosyltransferase